MSVFRIVIHIGNKSKSDVIIILYERHGFKTKRLFWGECLMVNWGAFHKLHIFFNTLADIGEHLRVDFYTLLSKPDYLYL